MNATITATFFDALVFVIVVFGTIILLASRPHLIAPFVCWLAGVGVATAIATFAVVEVLKSQLGMAAVAMAIGMPL